MTKDQFEQWKYVAERSHKQRIDIVKASTMTAAEIAEVVRQLTQAHDERIAEIKRFVR